MRMMDETSVIGSGYDDRLEHPHLPNDVGQQSFSYNKHNRQHVVAVRHNFLSTLILHTRTMADKSYIIVGAGVFGVSTAFHLIKKYPNADITIVDRDAFDQDTRVAASWDWNKVVRADYDDIVYCKMAIEAQDMFKTDNLWKPYFYQTGIYWMCRSDYAQEVVDNYKKLGRAADLKAVPIDEARKMYGGLFEDADYTGVKEVLVNKTSGWATAGECLIGITREALRLGVKYKQAEVASLLLDNGRCTGIKTAAGETLTAKHTLLCTGAYTPKLLEYCAQASGNNDLCAGDRIVAGGITTGMTRLDEDSYRRFASMPVGVQGYTAETGKSLFFVYSTIVCLP